MASPPSLPQASSSLCDARDPGQAVQSEAAVPPTAVLQDKPDGVATEPAELEKPSAQNSLQPQP
eukprot:4913799-Lingulodinium_polyedra.AAC.1